MNATDTPMNDLINDLKVLANQFRTNDEFTALKNIQAILNKITSDPSILINCDINRLSNINAAMYDCQKKSDWLGLADYLEYDLVRTINSKIDIIQI